MLPVLNNLDYPLECIDNHCDKSNWNEKPKDNKNDSRQILINMMIENCEQKEHNRKSRCKFYSPACFIVVHFLQNVSGCRVKPL